MTEVIADLRQKHIEDLELQLAMLPPYRTAGGVKLSRHYGAFLRAGIAAGWFGESGTVEEVTTKAKGESKTTKRFLLNGDEVGDMLPEDVRLLGESVELAYENAVTVDPK